MPFRMDEGQPPAATGMVTTRPLSCEGMTLSLAVQGLTLVHFADTRPDRTLSNTPHERESQPLYLNPIQNTRMGEPVHSQTAPPTLSPRPPNPSAHLTRPLPEPLHHSPNSQPTLPSTQPAESPSAHPTQHRQRMPRKPRGITQKGLKQSMQLHSSTVAKHAYNKFRVRNFPSLVLLR